MIFVRSKISAEDQQYQQMIHGPIARVTGGFRVEGQAR